MAVLSRAVLLSLLAVGALSLPAPVRVPLGDDDDAAGVGGDLADAEDGDDSNAEADSTGTRPVAILEHRQELQDDGTFNYAFSADNGLSQNEAFHPDGSRTGSYSYVDPKGETILVKYRADRFGFHVLDGSSIPSTMPHLASAGPRPASPHQEASSDYGAHEQQQADLEPNYFNYPASTMAGGLASIKTAATASSASGRAAQGVAPIASGRARSSASSSMHFLQREAREAFVSDDEVEVDGEESRVAMRKVRPPPGLKTAPSNEVDAAAAPAEAANDEARRGKYDDGSYERHAANYDDGSYERHAANYDDGSYERHSANYDDGSYEPHAAKYDDGSYEKYARIYDDGAYRQHQEQAQDGGEGEPLA